MRMSHLRYFVEVARTQNITLAAKNLHLSQPSLTYAVKVLEDELGVPLLFRHAHTISLTDAGEKFAARAKEITESTDELTGLMQAHGRLLKGCLRLGMLWIAGYMDLFALLNDFRGVVPAVTYEMAFDGSDVLMNGLMSKHLHGVFVISSPTVLESQPELHSVRLSTEEYVCIVPETSRLSSKDALSVKDLDGENVIMPSEKTLLSRQLSGMFEQEGVRPRVLCSTSQSDIVGQLTASGLGIGFASSTVAERICGENCRIIPFAEGEKIHRMMYFVTLSELLEYPLTKAFAEFVAGKEKLPEGASPAAL